MRPYKLKSSLLFQSVNRYFLKKKAAQLAQPCVACEERVVEKPTVMKLKSEA